MLDLHGYGDLHPELNRLSKEGRWEEMAGLVDDELIATIAVVGALDEIAPAVRARLDGISDHVSLVNNRAPDPRHLEVIPPPGSVSGTGAGEQFQSQNASRAGMTVTPSRVPPATRAPISSAR